MLWSILCKCIPRHKNCKLMQKTNQILKSCHALSQNRLHPHKIRLKGPLTLWTYHVWAGTAFSQIISISCFVFLLSSNICIFVSTRWFRMDLVFFLLAHPPTSRAKIRYQNLGKGITLIGKIWKGNHIENGYILCSHWNTAEGTIFN